MARALLVGCGCRGRMLGTRLLADGWSVRGTSRSDQGVASIEASGIEAAVADPDRLGTVTDLIGDITVVAWLMGSAGGPAARAVNSERLESLLERLVDTPVRGFVYEGRGSAGGDSLDVGAEMVTAAAERWRIPVRILGADPTDADVWVEEAAAAIAGVLTPAA